MTENENEALRQIFGAIGQTGAPIVIGQVIGSQTNYFGKIGSEDEKSPNTHTDAEQAVNNPIYSETIEKVFRFPNEFVKQHIASVTNEFYQGCAANLALIERTLFDHGQLKKNNQHKAFVQALVDWGIIDTDTDIAKTTAGMSSKLRSPFPQDGYKSWGKEYTNDAETCKRIGEKLPESMQYCRE